MTTRPDPETPTPADRSSPEPELRETGEPGHTRRRLVRHGVRVGEARAAAILVHGRGGSPEGMLALVGEQPVEGLAWVAPYADGNTWYPARFTAPLEENEPWLSSALEWLDEIVSNLGEEGIPPRRIGFVGFSQGGCLASEFAARRPRRYGAVVVLSGGLIGPPSSDFEGRFGLARESVGSPGEGGAPSSGPLAGTPVFLGCGDSDSHIPEERVRESGRILEALGADVDLRIYPGMGHSVNDEELGVAHSLLEDLTT